MYHSNFELIESSSPLLLLQRSLSYICFSTSLFNCHFPLDFPGCFTCCRLLILLHWSHFDHNLKNPMTLCFRAFTVLIHKWPQYLLLQPEPHLLLPLAPEGFVMMCFFRGWLWWPKLKKKTTRRVGHLWESLGKNNWETWTYRQWEKGSGTLKVNVD